MSVVEKATLVLTELSHGNGSAADRLFPLVYDELRVLAKAYLLRERINHTLQPTALVHEAYLRLINETRIDWQGKSHFMAIAARCIRQILINHARDRRAAKRGGDVQRYTLHEEDAPDEDRSVIDLIDLDEALSELTQRDERQANVVELRYFGGLSVQQTALVLDVSPGTVKGDWRFARVWLKERLSPEPLG
ncbi:MAG: sigma-70 family RNA polymerase sigma factor [Planctomycetota bacterium]|nr:sigma-70 family RNA polymerase sigma factor [Planctomycetota bacterium]